MNIGARSVYPQSIGLWFGKNDGRSGIYSLTKILMKLGSLVIILFIIGPGGSGAFVRGIYGGPFRGALHNGQGVNYAWHVPGDKAGERMGP